MSLLIRIIIVLLILFALTFLLVKSTGPLSLDQIKIWLESLQEESPQWIGFIIAGLLFADLFIPVPTLALCVLSGFFLGFPLGGLFTFFGTTLTGVGGYLIGEKFGRFILKKLVKDEEEIVKLEEVFQKYGPLMIVFSRGLPMFPEISACLSGVTKIGFKKFLFFWFINSIPYTFLASYLGSISSIDNPRPALFGAIGITVFFWTSWLIAKRTKMYRR